MLFSERTRRIAQKVAVITLGPLIFFGSVFDAQAQGPNPNRTPPRRPPSADGLPPQLLSGKSLSTTISCANPQGGTRFPDQKIINGGVTVFCGEMSPEMETYLIEHPSPQRLPPIQPVQPTPTPQARWPGGR